MPLILCRALFALAIGAIAASAQAQSVGISNSIIDLALRTRSLAPPPTYIPALDFSDARNSQYLSLI